MAVSDSGMAYICCSAGLAKLWMALSEQVLQKKKEKHSHTDGRRRKASGCSGTAAGAALPPGPAATAWRSSSASRCHTMVANTSNARAAPLRQATRHEPVAVAMPAMNTGAVAQPRLPEMPCTAKPWPKRCGDTRLFRMVKSTGWNGALPSPASTAASTSPG